MQLESSSTGHRPGVATPRTLGKASIPCKKPIHIVSLDADSVRFGSWRSAYAGSIDENLLNELLKFKNHGTPEFANHLSKIKDPQLQNLMNRLAGVMKDIDNKSDLIDFMTFSPLLILGGIPPLLSIIPRMKRKQQILEALKLIKALPNDNLKDAWIRKAIDTYERSIKLVGYQAIPLMEKGSARDTLIALACRNDNFKIRKLGVQMLGLIQNEQTKKELVTALLLDPSEKIKTMVKSGNITPLDLPALEELTLSETNPCEGLALPSGNPIQFQLQEKIDSQAQNMEARFKQLFDSNPTVQKALLEQFGDSAHLPKAADFKKQFHHLAQTYLQEKRTPMQKLFGKAPATEAVLELTLTLMDMANKTGAFLLKGNSQQFITQLEEIRKHQQALEEDLKQARNVVSQQVLLSAQTDADYQIQQEKITQLEAALKTAEGEQNDIEIAKLKHQLGAEKALHEEISRQKKLFATACGLAQANVETLSNRMTMLHRRIGQALQLGLMDQSREKLNTLLDKNTDLAHNPQLQKMLDQADDQKYQLMAEQAQDETVKPKSEKPPLQVKTVGGAR